MKGSWSFKSKWRRKLGCKSSPKYRFNLLPISFEAAASEDKDACDMAASGIGKREFEHH